MHKNLRLMIIAVFLSSTFLLIPIFAGSAQATPNSVEDIENYNSHYSSASSPSPQASIPTSSYTSPQYTPQPYNTTLSSFSSYSGAAKDNFGNNYNYQNTTYAPTTYLPMTYGTDYRSGGQTYDLMQGGYVYVPPSVANGSGGRTSAGSVSSAPQATLNYAQPSYQDYVKYGGGTYGPVNEGWYNANVINSSTATNSPAPISSIAGSSYKQYFGPNFSVSDGYLTGTNIGDIRVASSGAENRGWRPTDAAYLDQTVAQAGVPGSYSAVFNKDKQVENIALYGTGESIPQSYKTTTGDYTVISPNPNVNARAVFQAVSVNPGKSIDRIMDGIAPSNDRVIEYYGDNRVVINVYDNSAKELQSAIAELPSSKFLAPNYYQNITSSADDITPQLIETAITQVDQKYADGRISDRREYKDALYQTISSLSTNQISGNTAVYENGRLSALNIHVSEPPSLPDLTSTSTQTSPL